MSMPLKVVVRPIISGWLKTIALHWGRSIGESIPAGLEISPQAVFILPTTLQRAKEEPFIRTIKTSLRSLSFYVFVVGIFGAPPERIIHAASVSAISWEICLSVMIINI